MSDAAVMDPEVFLALEDLELAGRGLAEAVWHGRHASSRNGSGTEFHRHRAYVPGDDLRRVNWALLARHRKLYTKESRLEARRPVYILVDATASMGAAHGPWSKFNYVARAAAGLAWLAEGQGDSSSLALLRNGLESVVTKGSGQRHYAGICAGLAAASPGGQGNFQKVSDELGTLCKQPGFVILISDFFDRETELLGDLAGLKARGHDVLALQVLDPMEARLPESGDYHFVDLESGEKLRTSVEDLRKSHAKEVDAWRDHLKSEALAGGIRWATATTADPIVPLLRSWLDFRGAVR